MSANERLIEAAATKVATEGVLGFVFNATAMQKQARHTPLSKQVQVLFLVMMIFARFMEPASPVVPLHAWTGLGKKRINSFMRSIYNSLGTEADIDLLGLMLGAEDVTKQIWLFALQIMQGTGPWGKHSGLTRRVLGEVSLGDAHGEVDFSNEAAVATYVAKLS
eukprot:CAMPEP_0171777746 /NCGR_PEP_ID=MMETSP0991-20121206/57970_1 /TAXON_ID=483369 /ORGANISM="non described non described, Strain CCMP2098" /LENGTH=163 /DNA_ID=CAMNT_0012384529 /DNA_START=221 /DNA_END=708 /DNA_ORIENTATION=-